MGTDKIHPKVPRSWITQGSLLPTLKGYSNQGVPYNTIIFKMGMKDLRNCRLISSSSGPRILWGKSTEKLIFRHTKMCLKRWLETASLSWPEGNHAKLTSLFSYKGEEKAEEVISSDFTKVVGSLQYMFLTKSGESRRRCRGTTSWTVRLSSGSKCGWKCNQEPAISNVLRHWS